MCPQRLGILSGELASIFCLPGKVYTGEGWRWMLAVSCVAINLCKKSVGFMSGKYPKMPEWSHWFFFSLFQMLVQRLSTLELEKWAVVSWRIWNARNKVYFERVQAHPKSHSRWGYLILAWIPEPYGCTKELLINIQIYAIGVSGTTSVLKCSVCYCWFFWPLH